MRFMMIVKATQQTEAGDMGKPEDYTKMGQYNDALVKAGVLLAGDGLHPSSKGFRVRFGGPKPQIVDGPFAEAKELVAGYWLIQVKSREEAIQWASRAPFDDGELEVRQVFDPSDFPEGLVDPETVRKEEEYLAEQARKAPRA